MRKNTPRQQKKLGGGGLLGAMCARCFLLISAPSLRAERVLFESSTIITSLSAAASASRTLLKTPPRGILLLPPSPQLAFACIACAAKMIYDVNSPLFRSFLALSGGSQGQQLK